MPTTTATRPRPRARDGALLDAAIVDRILDATDVDHKRPRLVFPDGEVSLAADEFHAPFELGVLHHELRAVAKLNT